MQNTVQSTNALFPEDAIMYIANYSTSMTNDSLVSLTGATWTNLGALTEMSAESKIETKQPASVNVEHEQVISKMAETINVTIQELNMTNYNKLMGQTAQSVSVAGSTTSAIETYAAGSVSTAAEKFYRFDNQNWTSTSATIPITPSNIVISGSSTYVIGVSYEVLQDEDSYWGWKIESTGAFTSTSALTISYGFTPKSQSILYHGGADTLQPCMLKIYSIYADGRTITTYYPRVEYVSGGSINHKAGGSGEFKDMKFGLEAREHQSYTYNSRKQYKIEVQTTA